MARRKKAAAEQAGPVVRLRHAFRSGNWRMYFYDGELPIEDATLTIPANKPEWVQRAWIQGFRLTAEGRVIADLAKHIRAETTGEEPVTEPTPAPEAENAESVEEKTDEGTDDGGLAPDDDGVRSGESPRDDGVPAGGDDSSDGDEPAAGGEGDESAD